MLFRRLAAVLLTFLALTVVGRAHVKASLVAAETAIQPGRAFTVALRLEHEPHWHSYWINAGTGYPTSLAWKLPDGWTAGDIQWPVPIAIKDRLSNITGNGYEGVILLPVTLTPPASLKPGETLTLQARAEWLMCADVCVPGAADLTLTLPVGADAPKTNDATRTALAALPMPHAADGWELAAYRVDKNDKTLTLIVRAAASSGGAALKSPRFFSSDAFVQYDQPQPVRTDGDRVALALPVSPSYEGNGARVVGVLAYTDAAGVYRGASVDVAVKTGPPPVTVATASTAGSDAAGATKPAAGLAGTLALAFVGGLILNLMPCVFPVLGIKILGFVNQAGADRKKVTMHGLTFTLGVLLSFWLLGGLLITAWQGTGWGTQLQHPEANFTIAAIFLVFALSLSGVFEIGLSATRVGTVVAGKTGLVATLLEGAFITVVATPCSAPLLGTALGAAMTTLPPAQAMLVFTFVALGLSFPYLVLSAFPAGVKLLPRPGAWMETFKQLMAFPVYAAVGFFFWIMAAQVPEGAHLSAAFGLTTIAMAAWLYGRYAAFGAKPTRARIGVWGGVVLVAAGVWLGWPKAPAPDEIKWAVWSPQAVAEAQAKGKSIYVDFTARWCATCQVNKTVVFSSKQLRRFFRDRDVVALKADWTNQDPQITAELARFGRSAVPVNLVYKPGSAEPVVLPELLTPSTVLDALGR